MTVILSARSGAKICGRTGRVYLHPAEVVFGQFLLEGGADLLGNALGLGDGQIVRQPAEELDGAVLGVDLRGEAQVREAPGQDLADLQGLGDVLLAGNLAAVPVAIHRHLHGHPALLDAEIALPGQVRGQRSAWRFHFSRSPVCASPSTVASVI